MLLVEYFHKALDKASIKTFRQALLTWYIVVRESKLEPFIKLAKMIRRYRKNIETSRHRDIGTMARFVRKKLS